VKKSLPRRFATWLGIPCLVLLLACRAFADDNVIGESGGGTQKAATTSKKSPDNASQEELKSEIAELRKNKKELQQVNHLLEEIRRKSAKPVSASSPQSEPVRSESKAPVADWAGTWTGELVCIGSPKGQEGRTGTFVVKIDPDERRGCSYAVNTKPLPSRVKVSGERAVVVGATDTEEGSMQVTVVMDRTSHRQATVTARILMKASGVTAALTGEMERR